MLISSFILKKISVHVTPFTAQVPVTLIDDVSRK